MSETQTTRTEPSDLLASLRAIRFGREVEWTTSVDSTNARALVLAAEGAPEGTLVATDHQTAGRGRQGRTWSDSPGHNLLFSIVLRPTLPTEHFGLIPLAAGLAIAETIEQHVGLVARLKWPNDILLDRRKVCGVLMEGHLHPVPGEKNYLVLGVGLNVNQTDFEASVEDKATSLALESGHLIPRIPLLAQLLDRLELRYDSLSGDGGQSVREEFEKRMVGLNELARVAFSFSSESVQGIIRGIAINGALRLETEQGEKLLHAGEVTLQNAAIEAN